MVRGRYKWGKTRKEHISLREEKGVGGKERDP